MKKNILICFDRDGTLIYDDNYHLGSQRNWKSLIKILPNVIKGLKKLKKALPKAKFYFITNQPGVAIKDFSLLTRLRAHEVCEYVLKEFSKKGVQFDGYRLCGKASPVYVKKRTEFIFNKKDVGNFPCIKPNSGMIKDILKSEKLNFKNTIIYVIGDRKSDIETAKRIRGWGIHVFFKNRPKERVLVSKLKYSKKYLTKSFLDAISFIIKNEAT